jgi:hypothetical protein
MNRLPYFKNLKEDSLFDVIFSLQTKIFEKGEMLCKYGEN